MSTDRLLSFNDYAYVVGTINDMKRRGMALQRSAPKRKLPRVEGAGCSQTSSDMKDKMAYVRSFRRKKMN